MTKVELAEFFVGILAILSVLVVGGLVMKNVSEQMDPLRGVIDCPVKCNITCLQLQAYATNKTSMGFVAIDAMARTGA